MLLAQHTAGTAYYRHSILQAQHTAGAAHLHAAGCCDEATERPKGLAERADVDVNLRVLFMSTETRTRDSKFQVLCACLFFPLLDAPVCQGAEMLDNSSHCGSTYRLEWLFLKATRSITCSAHGAQCIRNL